MNVINQDIQHENVIVNRYAGSVTEEDIQRKFVDAAEKELRKEENKQEKGN